MNSNEIALTDFLDNPRRFLMGIRSSESLDCLTDLLQNYFLDLVRESSRDVALEKIFSIATETQFSPTIQASCEQAMLWLSAGKYDPIITPAIVEASSRSAFALADHLKSFLPHEKAPFFLSAFMPKSGGTFITGALKKNCGYNTEIGFFVGNTGETRFNYLLKAQLPIFGQFGGIFNHAHLDPNPWNQCAIRESGLPFWLNLRDPRDCLLSAVNMIDMERLREDEISKQFYADLNQQYGDDIMNASLNQRAEMMMETFEDYCAWASEWMAFNYEWKFVTFHQQLQDDPEGVSMLVNDKLGLGLAPDAFRVASNENYKSSRLNVGTNGRWAKEFEPSFCDTLFEIMKRHHLDAVFPLESVPVNTYRPVVRDERAGGIADIKPAAHPDHSGSAGTA